MRFIATAKKSDESNFWLVECPCLCIMTQVESPLNAKNIAIVMRQQEEYSLTQEETDLIRRVFRGQKV